MSTVHNERGVALAVAVFALVVIGGLVGGAFFLGMQEQRVGWNTLKHQQAFSAAQEGAQLEVANWNTGTYNGLTVGDSAAFAGMLSNNAGWYRGSVMRLNDNM
jgi:Tfp pilus assembly protein PilX